MSNLYLYGGIRDLSNPKMISPITATLNKTGSGRLKDAYGNQSITWCIDEAGLRFLRFGKNFSGPFDFNLKRIDSELWFGKYDSLDLSQKGEALFKMVKSKREIFPHDRLSLLCEEKFEKAKDILNLKKEALL